VNNGGKKMYRLTKRDSKGKVYEVVIRSNADLVAHLRGTFLTTDHELIAVIKIGEEANARY